ncbi:MAG TPA: hypothetical protein VFW65_39715, partial [Pseudonocardiaceae bacterium]|nr:hypothetical protein [Pseudonocardiaceae bacterium]
ELAKTVRRVVDKLLHTPTVRVKQLASGPNGASYADALRELFALDPQVEFAADAQSDSAALTQSVDCPELVVSVTVSDVEVQRLGLAEVVPGGKAVEAA